MEGITFYNSKIYVIHKISTKFKIIFFYMNISISTIILLYNVFGDDINCTKLYCNHLYWIKTNKNITMESIFQQK